MQEGMDMKTYRWIALTALASAVMAQTRVDLRTQGKSVDFSAATATKPAKTGTVFPSTCSVGEMYFKTDAGAGANLYACTATNIWSLEGGSGTSSLPAMTGNTNRVLSNNGSAADWRLVGGDITGSPDNLSVIGLRGRIVSAAAPTGGQALVWNSSTVQWEPQN
jgi:trimeric autotransporter adhesin